MKKKARTIKNKPEFEIKVQEDWKGIVSGRMQFRDKKNYSSLYIFIEKGGRIPILVYFSKDSPLAVHICQPKDKDYIPEGKDDDYVFEWDHQFVLKIDSFRELIKMIEQIYSSEIL